jgi:hypothetical protein
MTQRRLVSLLTAAAAIALAAPSAAFAGAGFTVPSRNTTCGLVAAGEQEGVGAGLYCSSTYVRGISPDYLPGVAFPHNRKARPTGLGNDLSLAADGDLPKAARPVLGYGRTWRRGGYTCVSRSTGLTCRRGSHGFLLSREKQSYY